MSEKYEHEGKHFTKQIAAELIFKTYLAKPPVDETTLPEKVYQIHEVGGGLPPEVRYPNPATANSSDTEKTIHFAIGGYVRGALSELRSNGCATKESSRLWQIHKIDIHRDERTYPKRLGEGSQEVYLYYFPAYRELVIRKKITPVWKINVQKIFWRCKIGETHDQDVETRVKQQTRISPEKPTIALIMKFHHQNRWEINEYQVICCRLNRSLQNHRSLTRTGFGIKR